MNKNWVLTQDAFDTLLSWLDPNREVAGQKYEAIRQRLVKIFSCRGCAEPEDLADETINRVTSKLPAIEADFVGDPSRYFYGVANKVHLEYRRPKPAPEIEPPPPYDENIEREFECLESCMKKLTTEKRQLVIEYYQDERQAKIDHRKALAAKLGIAINALRIRAFRIRASLQECVTNCMQAAVAVKRYEVNRHSN
jgi:DNA-directed RNA polymerase specialized sigma24 family protein